MKVLLILLLGCLARGQDVPKLQDLQSPQTNQVLIFADETGKIGYKIQDGKLELNPGTTAEAALLATVDSWQKTQKQTAEYWEQRDKDWMALAKKMEGTIGMYQDIVKEYQRIIKGFTDSVKKH